MLDPTVGFVPGKEISLMYLAPGKYLVLDGLHRILGWVSVCSLAWDESSADDPAMWGTVKFPCHMFAPMGWKNIEYFSQTVNKITTLHSDTLLPDLIKVVLEKKFFHQ